MRNTAKEFFNDSLIPSFGDTFAALRVSVNPPIRPLVNPNITPQIIPQITKSISELLRSSWVSFPDINEAITPPNQKIVAGIRPRGKPGSVLFQECFLC